MVENAGVGIERYMNLVSARQKLVASNIANADTPGYKTKDIDFQTELESQIGNLEPNSDRKSPASRPRTTATTWTWTAKSRLLAENALRFSRRHQFGPLRTPDH
jgi:flagellar basal-body rod protein FlgB